MFLALFLLLLGLAMILIGGNILVEGASSLAKSYRVPNIVIGLTIVAFGTSSPELAVGVYGSLSGSPEITIGNALGSNICNILLILGVSSVIFPLNILQNTVKKEIPFALLGAVLLFTMLRDTVFVDATQADMVSVSEGITLLLFFCIFMYYLVSLAKKSPDNDTREIKLLNKYLQVAYIVGGLALLVIGGRILVDNAVKLALSAGMTEAMVALTIVAIGTSVPELATSIIAAYKKNAAIAVGNVVGSNIFNSFFVLGSSAVIKPLPIGTISNVDLAMNIIAHLLLFITGFIIGKNRIQRVEGMVFLLAFVLYMGYLIKTNL